MKSCIVDKNNIVTNIIVCEDEETAKELGAVPYYDGAKIENIYDPYNYYALAELKKQEKKKKKKLDALTGVTE